MTDPVKEQLSACLDGELPADELDLLLRQLGRDPQLRASVGRYSLIGETLRTRAVVAAPKDFAERISATIAAEATVPTAVSKPARAANSAVLRWLRPAAGVAIAAGVAAVAVIAMQPATHTPQATFAVNSAASIAPTSDDAASYIVPASTASSGFVPAARLTNYVVAHSEYSSPLGRRSVLSGVLAEADEADEAEVADEPTGATNASSPETVINR